MDVLICHQDPGTLARLEGLVSGWGYTVSALEDCAKARSILNDPNVPPLAILEASPPMLWGLEIRNCLRMAGKALPTYVLLLYSELTGVTNEDLVASGADDSISLPFDEHELGVRLRAGKRIVELQADLRRQRDDAAQNDFR